MSRIIMYPHGGSGNHGCEAIVRTTVEMLEGNEIFLFSDNPNEDEKYLSDLSINIKYPRKSFNKNSIEYLNKKIRQVFCGQKNIFDIAAFSPILDLCDQNSILLSIGGDNYCYGGNDFIDLVNREARKKRTKTILWGASVDQSLVNEKMVSDLSEYSLIITRETISYNYLKTINNNTYLMPDPAFSLLKQKTTLPDIMNNRNTIGLNVSPMIFDYSPDKESLISSINNLIDYILEDTSFNLALIPHVVWETNNDYSVLSTIRNKYSNSDRVFLIEDQNCMKLKYIISQCRFFIGARTHATIAAYSSNVPTIVLGYSVKSKGIANDIFDKNKNYVFSVCEQKDCNQLKEMFIDLVKNEEKIKQQLIYYQERNKEKVDIALLKLKNMFYE